MERIRQHCREKARRSGRGRIVFFSAAVSRENDGVTERKIAGCPVCFDSYEELCHSNNWNNLSLISGLQTSVRSVKLIEGCKDLHFQLALSYILLLPLAALPHAPVRDSRKKEPAGQARNYPLEPERAKIQRIVTVSFLERNVF